MSFTFPSKIAFSTILKFLYSDNFLLFCYVSKTKRKYIYENRKKARVRGARAARFIREGYSWKHAIRHMGTLLDEAVAIRQKIDDKCSGGGGVDGERTV